MAPAEDTPAIEIEVEVEIQIQIQIEIEIEMNAMIGFTKYNSCIRCG